MSRYRRLSYQDRVEIHRLLKLEWHQVHIAARLGVHPSTISRELSRNSGKRGYRHKQAQELTDDRFFGRNWFTKMTPEMCDVLVSYLEDGWTPEQISKRFKLEDCAYVCHETIYKFIEADAKAGGCLFKHLPRHHRIRRKRRRKIHDKRGLIANMRNIKERPKSVDKRTTKGDWERDSMLCKDRSRSVLVAVERKTRFVVAHKCENHHAKTVHQATLKALRNQVVKTITNDQGKEFALHEHTAAALKTRIYFCDAGKPYQRGLNEGKIAILRRYLPKGTCLKNLTQRQLNNIVDKINRTPMKCLKWLTPYEKMFNKRIALVC